MATLAHVTHGWTIPGPKVMTCGLDFELDQALTTEAELVQWATQAGVAYAASPSIRDVISSSMTLSFIEVFMYDVVPNPAGVPAFKRQIALGPAQVAFAINGTEPGGPMPPQVSVVVSFKSQVSSRRRRGRIFLPPPPITAVNANGTLTDAYRTEIESVFPDWVNAVGDSSPLFAQPTQIIQSLAGGDHVAVSSIDVRNRVDTQRRRLSRQLDT